MVRILVIFVILLFFWLFLKYFQRNSVYFPIREIEVTPKDIGLEYEDIFFKTSDGVVLNGWFISTPQSKATLIFCHGNGGNISHRLESINNFHKIGFNVFIFDYRGYGKSKGTVSEEGTYLDAVAAYNYVASRQDVAKDKTIAFGRSLGGVIAIELAIRTKVALLICESSFVSIMDMAKQIYKVRIPGCFLAYRYDALSKIRNVIVPKLIIHSQDDEIVPFFHGERLFQAAKKPKEFYTLRGGHNNGFLATGNDYLEYIETFVEKYL